MRFTVCALPQRVCSATEIQSTTLHKPFVFNNPQMALPLHFLWAQAVKQPTGGKQ